MRLRVIKQNRISFFLITYALFILFFLIDKIIFFFHHWEKSSTEGFTECLKVLWHGLPMDISMAGYFMIIPGLVILVSLFTTRYLKQILSVYFLIILLFANIVAIPDMELYTHWGFRMDKTIFAYINSPKEVLASIPLWSSILIFLFFSGYTFLQYYTLKRISLKYFPQKAVKHKILSLPITLFLLALLIIPIRGGLTVATMNVSRVYFSDSMFLNHAALNPVFNMLASLEQTEKLEEQYRFFPENKMEEIFEDLMSHSCDSVPGLLKTDRPNIIFIVLESFGKAILQAQENDMIAAPNLLELTKEGIFFNQMYANSFRTDRGIVSVLGGYPAQPTMSILKYPAKVENLESIPKSLKENGYANSMLYGGDLSFAGIRSFFVSQGVTDIVDEKNFPFKYAKTKWGAPDHLTFEYFTQQIAEEKNEPFCKIFLTLSSHEPFDVPTKKFEHPYLNSVAYTDSCLGVFITALKNTEIWDNSLIILVPDHNMRFPSSLNYHVPERYDIFMLWLGGAIKQPAIIDKLCSQVDIAATLLGQLGVDYSDFIFSKNITDPSVNEFAFYDFPNGFGMISKEGMVVYDCQTDQIVLKQGKNQETLLSQGKAYLQKLYSDIILR